MSCNLNLSEDQHQIIDAAQSLLDEHFPVSRLRQKSREPLEAIAEFGGFSLALPEEIGGSGFTLVEEVLIHVLFGRHLVSTSALAASLGTRLASEANQNTLAQRLASGDAQICAGVESEDGYLLFDATDASYALVWGDQRLQLMELHSLTIQPLESMGHGRPLSRVQPNPQSICGKSVKSSLVHLADLLVSAQLLGIAEATRDLSVSYAAVREQFGRPIGSFQAIKHQCADMAIGAEMLSALLDMAAIAQHDGRGDAEFQTGALRRLAPKIAFANARQTIQIHGGIGFSAEADAHHFLKQVHILNQLGGHSDFMSLAAPLTPIERT